MKQLTRKKLTLSIVIPVYNEEDHIGQCLEAIAAQSTPPLEVIVVDNNCTDRTVVIARTYSFVKVVTEAQQGRAAARNKGFNVAKGNIIGRIDADSTVMPNWVERVLADFSNKKVAGVTGLAQTNLLLGLNKLHVTFWSRVYFWASHATYGIHTMWGANMALRRTCWAAVRSYVAADDEDLHEDVDMSFLLIGAGGTILQDNKLLIKTAGKSYLYWPKFWNYYQRGFSTRRYHKQRKTLARLQPSPLHFWRYIITDTLGRLFTVLFMLYSLCVWPIFAVLLRLSANPKKTLR